MNLIVQNPDFPDNEVRVSIKDIECQNSHGTEIPDCAGMTVSEDLASPAYLNWTNLEGGKKYVVLVRKIQYKSPDGNILAKSEPNTATLFCTSELNKVRLNVGREKYQMTNLNLIPN